MDFNELSNPELFLNTKVTKNMDYNFFNKNYSTNYDISHNKSNYTLGGGKVLNNIKSKCSSFMNNEFFFNLVILLVFILILSIFLYYRYKKKQRKIKKLKKFYSSGMYKKYQENQINNFKKNKQNIKRNKIIDSLNKTKSLKAFNDIF